MSGANLSVLRFCSAKLSCAELTDHSKLRHIHFFINFIGKKKVSYTICKINDWEIFKVVTHWHAWGQSQLKVWFTTSWNAVLTQVAEMQIVQHTSTKSIR